MKKHMSGVAAWVTSGGRVALAGVRAYSVVR